MDSKIQVRLCRICCWLKANYRYRLLVLLIFARTFNFHSIVDTLSHSVSPLYWLSVSLNTIEHCFPTHLGSTSYVRKHKLVEEKIRDITTILRFEYTPSRFFMIFYIENRLQRTWQVYCILGHQLQTTTRNRVSM